MADFDDHSAWDSSFRPIVEHTAAQDAEIAHLRAEVRRLRAKNEQQLDVSRQGWAEVDRLRAELDRARPVLDAANEWDKVRTYGPGESQGWVASQLAAAVRAYREQTEDRPSYYFEQGRLVIVGPSSTEDTAPNPEDDFVPMCVRKGHDWHPATGPDCIPAPVTVHPTEETDHGQ